MALKNPIKRFVSFFATICLYALFAVSRISIPKIQQFTAYLHFRCGTPSDPCPQNFRILQILALNSSWASIAQRSASSVPAMEKERLLLQNLDRPMAHGRYERERDRMPSPHLIQVSVSLNSKIKAAACKNKSTLPRAPIAVFKTSWKTRHL